MSKTWTRTSKRIDRVLKDLWEHLTAKAKNKTSSGYARLHPIEATILQNWGQLREEQTSKDVGKQPTQDEFLAHVKKEGLLDEMQEKQVIAK